MNQFLGSFYRFAMEDNRRKPEGVFQHDWRSFDGANQKRSAHRPIERLWIHPVCIVRRSNESISITTLHWWSLVWREGAKLKGTLKLIEYLHLKSIAGTTRKILKQISFLKTTKQLGRNDSAFAMQSVCRSLHRRSIGWRFERIFLEIWWSYRCIHPKAVPSIQFRDVPWPRSGSIVVRRRSHRQREFGLCIDSCTKITRKQTLPPQQFRWQLSLFTSRWQLKLPKSRFIQSGMVLINYYHLLGFLLSQVFCCLLLWWRKKTQTQKRNQFNVFI